MYQTTTIFQLTTGTLNSIEIPFPPPDEQEQIARFLDVSVGKIDTLVSKKRELIDLLQEKRRALVSRCVTRGLPPDAARAAGLDPQPKLKPSGVDWLEEMPSHWKPSSLRRHCKKITDGSHISPDLSSEDKLFVSTVDIQNGIIDFENCLRTTHESYEYLVRTGCKPVKGDILFSKDGTIGRTAIVKTDHDFVVASSLVIIRPDSRVLESRFGDYWLNNSLLQQECNLLLAGAALRRISVFKVSRLPLLLPPPKEQEKIANFLDIETTKMDCLVEKVACVVDYLLEYRSALITAAVTGKIDVREVEV